MENVVTRIVGSFLIILIGFLLSRVGSTILMRRHRRKNSTSLEMPFEAKIFTYAIMTSSIVLALIALRFDIYTLFVDTIYSNMPFVISAVLLLILVILVVQFLFFMLNQFLSRSGLLSVVQDNQKEGVLNVSLSIMKWIVYIVLLLLSLNLLDIDVSRITAALGWVLMPIFILILGLFFVGLKSFVENLAFGLYIKATLMLRVGEIVRIRDMEGTIKSISYQGTLLETEKGFSIFILHRQLFKNFVYFKKVETDLATLEKIKNHFVAQRPSYCGPASASMILSLFGHEITQEKIGMLAKTEVGVGTHPKQLIGIVQKLTGSRVLGVWVGIDKIFSLRQELKTWLYDGAFPILDFKKSALFPDATTAHYVVCLAVRGDDLLILDPNEKKGGVYFVDYRKVQKGMDTYSKLIDGKRGYIVLAARGTKAYFRLQKGLSYSDSDLYTRLNARLKKRLDGIVTRSAVLEHILPKTLKKAMDDYKRRDKISRVWQPKSK